ncbi:MAG: hypothetical protein ACKOXP_00290 [Flavobacteriales bacterium]
MIKYLLLVFMSVQTWISWTQVTKSDFQEIIPYLEKEDWKFTFKRSGALLAANPTDSSDLHAMMVYIRLYSGAGLVSEHKLSYKKLADAVRPLIGQYVLMAAHPYAKGEAGGLNVTYVEKDSSQWTAFTSASNQAGTSIFCFEHMALKKAPLPYKVKSFIRCGGILQDIEFNPNESTIWIMRLKVSDAFVRSAE